MTTDPTNRTSVPQKTNLQYDYLLLDGSGSMCSKVWESLDAIDAYVSGLKAQNVNSHIRVATFSTAVDSSLDYDTVRDTPIDKWTPVITEPFGIRGGTTPLYDSINIMIKQLRDLDPPKVSIVIITDGDENSSKTNVHQAKALLDWERARGWQITFMGCDFDNQAQARLLGANDSNSVGTSAQRIADAAAELAKKRAHHAKYGTPMHFTDEERNRFSGYLSAPGK